jgi:hypothetical protein
MELLATLRVHPAPEMTTWPLSSNNLDGLLTAPKCFGQAPIGGDLGTTRLKLPILGMGMN